MENTNDSQLKTTLWECADILRGKMDANEYKDYVLGLLFYKYLSDKLLNDSAKLLDESGLSLAESLSSLSLRYL